MDKKTKSTLESYQRVIAFLNREQEDILDKIGKDALFSTGCKLSRSKIISSLVDLLIELDIDGKGISSLEELKLAIKKKLSEPWHIIKQALTAKDNPSQQSIKPFCNDDKRRG